MGLHSRAVSANDAIMCLKTGHSRHSLLEFCMSGMRRRNSHTTERPGWADYRKGKKGHNLVTSAFKTRILRRLRFQRNPIDRERHSRAGTADKSELPVGLVQVADSGLAI